LRSETASNTIHAVQKKILIVEQEERIALALERRLRARGYAPDLCRDHNEARDRFEADRPDMVIISLTLDGNGGPTLCGQLRKLALGGLVPILLLGTGSEEIHSVPAAIAAGADHFFLKPDGVSELLAKVATYIGPGQDNELTRDGFSVDGDSSESPAPEAPAAHEWAELDEILRTSVEDDGLPGPIEDLSEPLSSAPYSTPEPAPTSAPASSPPSDWSDEEPAAPPQSAPMSPSGALEPGTISTRGSEMPRGPAAEPMAVLDSLLDPGRPIDLAQRGIGEVLMGALNGRLTGRVEVASGGVLRRLFFDHGVSVYADSSAPEEDLVAYLAAEGYIAADALNRARTQARQLGVSAEEILIESGHLRADDVHRTLREHVIRRIQALFGLERGESVVVRGGPRPLDPVDLGQHPARLVLDGVRRKYGRLRLYRVFGTASAVPQPRTAAKPSAELMLRPDEINALKCSDGRRSVIEIARTAGLSEVDALAVLHGLVLIGLLEAPMGAGLSQLVPVKSDSLPTSLAPRTADELPGFGDLVRTKHQAVQGGDYFQVLGVDPAATTSELRAAYEDLSRRFDPHRVRRDSPLWHQVVDIAEVLDDAWRLLSDSRLRARYEAAIC
jgi:CheY-like chemotaxis protein